SGNPRVLGDGDLCLAVGRGINASAPQLYETLRETRQCPSGAVGGNSIVGAAVRIEGAPLMLNEGQSQLLPFETELPAAELDTLSSAKCLLLTRRPSRVNSTDLTR